MENRIPALSLGFGSSWTCWTGWICFSLLDLFRSSPLLKPKEFKCPAGDCAPPPLSRLLSSIFSSNEASLQISISWNTQSWLFQIASTGERLTASSEDCLVFYLRMSIIRNVCLWLVPAEILSHRHSSCCLLPPQASHRHADLMPIPRPLMALIGTICASHYNPLVPPPPLLR